MSLATVRLQPGMTQAQLVNALNQNFAQSENIDKDTFKIIDEGEVTISMASVAQGTQAVSTVSASHSLGFAPAVFAFITYDSPLTPGSTITRAFGGASVQAKSVSAVSVLIGYLSDEAVEATTSAVNFRWIVSNANPISTAPVTAKIKYYLITRPQ